LVPAGDEPIVQGKSACQEHVVGLGRKLNLHDVTCPAYLLAGADDDITTPEQVLDAAKYLGTPKDRIVQKTVPGGHIGLLMGSRTLKEVWPSIVRWIDAQ
jgi:poly(3-hydroxyalkanoate) synthetase